MYCLKPLSLLLLISFSVELDAFVCRVGVVYAGDKWFTCPAAESMLSTSRRLDFNAELAAKMGFARYVTSMKLMDTGSTSLKAFGTTDFTVPGYGFKVIVPQSFDMTCSNDVDDFPNACSGTVGVKIWWELNQDRSKFLNSEAFKFGIGLYAFSNFTGSEFRRVLVARYAALSRGVCEDDLEVTSGDCLGLALNSENMVGPKAGFPADPLGHQILAQMSTPGCRK